MTAEQQLSEIRAIIVQRTSDADKVRQIRALLEPEPPKWTDSGSGPGYDGPYDPRD